MKYDEETITQINNSVNVFEYANQYLDFEKRKGEYWSVCPFHDGDINPSISFNKEKSVFYCFGCHATGSTIQFIMMYHKLSFLEAIDYLIKFANISITPKEHSELLECLHKLNSKNKEKDVIKRVYLKKDIMQQYKKEPIIEWIAEGIHENILNEYDVRYDRNGNRIVFPIQDTNGGIVAVKGRTLYSNYNDLGIVKYIYYQPIITNNFLFGLHKNLQFIKEKNEVLVFEGCKAVMMAEGYGYKNSVSLETNRINEYQMDLLLQLKCDIVLCLDKGIKIVTKNNKSSKNKNVEVNIGLLPKLTNVYVVEDKEGLLEDKASPVDQGIEIWEKLYEERDKI